MALKIGALSAKEQQFVRIVALVEVDRFMAPYRWKWLGRKPQDRLPMAKAFIAKAVWNFPTSRALLDYVQRCPSLRRLCGWDSAGELPSESTFSRAFGEFAEIGLGETDRIKPRILSSQIIRRIDDHQAQLINRTRHGQMLIPGETLYVLELEPAAYAALAANEAEKAAHINILEVRAFGSMGRIYLGGEERDIDVGWRAAVAAIEGLEGREAKP